MDLHKMYHSFFVGGTADGLSRWEGSKQLSVIKHSRRRLRGGGRADAAAGAGAAAAAAFWLHKAVWFGHRAASSSDRGSAGHLRREDPLVMPVALDPLRLRESLTCHTHAVARSPMT